MVTDNMKHCELYYGMHKNFQTAFDFIKKATAENYDVGKYEIDGKDLYAFIQEYNSKLPQDAKAEAHRNYIDIQYIVAGTEMIEVFDIDTATAITEYRDANDLILFDNSEHASKCILHAGDYGIYFPHDIHRPGMCLNGVQEPIKKIVVKIKL